MPSPIDISQVELFTLIFIRIASALAVLPIFSHTAVPTIVKAGFAGVLALLITPLMVGTMPVSSGTILDYFALALRESVCGILIGFAGNLVFYAVDIAGQLIGFQAGFSVVSSIDPNTEAQSTVLTQFYNITAMLVFLSFDGHHMMIRALMDSFHTIPIGKLVIDARLSQWALAAVQSLTVEGIRLAAPLMVTLLLADVGLGILTRVAPTLNVFVIGFPLKIAITLTMISITLGAVFTMFSHDYLELSRNMPAFMRLLVAS